MNIIVWIMIFIGGLTGILSCLYLVVAMPVLIVWKMYRRIRYHISLYD